jgi:hypothetical protein
MEGDARSGAPNRMRRGSSVASSRGKGAGSPAVGGAVLGAGATGAIRGAVGLGEQPSATMSEAAAPRLAILS